MMLIFVAVRQQFMPRKFIAEFRSSLGADCRDRGATCKLNADIAQREGTRAVDAAVVNVGSHQALGIEVTQTCGCKVCDWKSLNRTCQNLSEPLKIRLQFSMADGRCPACAPLLQVVAQKPLSFTGLDPSTPSETWTRVT